VPWFRSVAGPVLATALVIAMSGCGRLGSAEDANAAQAAETFDRSLSDPSRACQLLAPGTLSELQDSFGPCQRSLPKQDLPAATEVVSVDVYGQDAMVRLEGDVVFLARFADGWKVTAAGCRLRSPGRPYTCTLKGQ
jgi:hypothetical protein